MMIKGINKGMIDMYMYNACIYIFIYIYMIYVCMHIYYLGIISMMIKGVSMSFYRKNN
jgi:hypothetical protein